MEQHGQPGGPGPDEVAATPATDDPLLQVRAALEDVEELPLDQRAAVFERTHAVVVEELRALELS